MPFQTRRFSGGGYGTRRDLDLAKELALLRELEAAAELKEIAARRADPYEAAKMDETERQFRSRRDVQETTPFPARRRPPAGEGADTIMGTSRTAEPPIRRITRSFQNDPGMTGLREEAEAVNDPNFADAYAGREADARLAPSVLAAEAYGRSYGTRGATRVIQTPSGPGLLDIRSGEVTPITDEEGNRMGFAPTAAARTEANMTDNLIELAEETLRKGREIGWEGVGPIAGPFGSARMSVTGGGSLDAETLRNLIDQVRTEASFTRGGKQLTPTERDLLSRFLAGVRGSPEQAEVRLENFIKQTKTRRRLIAPGIPSPGEPGAPPPTDDDTRYQNYLAGRGGR